MELHVQSVVTVEYDCGAAVESLLENTDSRIRLERPVDMRIRLLSRWAGAAAHERDRLDDRTADESISVSI